MFEVCIACRIEGLRRRTSSKGLGLRLRVWAPVDTMPHPVTIDDAGHCGISKLRK